MCKCALKQFFKELSGIRFFASADFFGCSAENKISAAVTAFGTEIDNMVGGFYYIKIVLDNNNGVSTINNAL